jgi:hypothetical protein
MIRNTAMVVRVLTEPVLALLGPPGGGVAQREPNDDREADVDEHPAVEVLPE